MSSFVWACHRAYKLYRGLGQAGSALVTAEDAAAACEELARATRRSSPSGKASRAATRADRAAEGAAQINCSLMICKPQILHQYFTHLDVVIGSIALLPMRLCVFGDQACWHQPLASKA